MVKSELKEIISKFMIDMMDEWFDDNQLFKALGKTVIQANVNRFDGVIDMLTDENGNVLINELIENIGDTFIGEGIQIDLTQYSSFLPPKVLLFSKSDWNNLINEIKKGM